MTLLDAVLHPDRLRLVGVEDDPDGGIRGYVIDRQIGLHVHVAAAYADRVRLALATDPHPFIPAPTSHLCDCATPEEDRRHAVT